MRRSRLALATLALSAASSIAGADTEELCESGGFGVDDYFDLRRVTELAMSSDGHRLVYAVEAYDGDARGRRVHLASLPDVEIEPLDELEDARSFAWIPRSRDLAFVSRVAGPAQVFSRLSGGAIRQVTQAKEPVESFRYSPDGRDLAFTTRAASEPGVSLYEKFREGTEGILIDPATTSSHDFVNPHWHRLAKRPPLALWIRRGGEAMRVPVPGEPSAGEQAYFWSTDGRYLSVTFVADDIPESQLRDERTSIGVLDTKTGDFRVVARGVPPQGGEPAVSFRGGEWIPGEHRLLIRRITEADPWVSESFPDWTVASASEDLSAQELDWRAIEIYPRGLKFMPLSASRILLANTVEGVHSLFVLTPEGIVKSKLVGELDGSSSLFTFSAGYAEVAFVNESLRRPPEIHVSRAGESGRRLTALNAGLSGKLRYSKREVHWTSTDGTEVGGWLLEPEQPRTSAGWPMITHVHGGPAFPYPDAFATYFSYWPYPLEVYPAHGVAVFLPNYRGTHTYGRRIAEANGDEPVADIVSGVEQLVSEGVADASRLGISGHSHGALVGPLAMARSGIFAASSFAEGVSNSVVMYELMSGDANREIHDAIMGASLYESPELYLEESADLQLAGVDTASLFEAGAYMTAIYMLGFPKAAEYAGMPTEFIVYPRTGHNIAIPALQRESAERNLDWFNFWLNGCESADRPNDSRYQRWRALKSASD